MKVQKAKQNIVVIKRKGVRARALTPFLYLNTSKLTCIS